MWVPTGRVSGSPPSLRSKREKPLDPEWKNTEEKSPPNNTHRFRKTEIALTNVTHLKINPEAQLQPWCSKATQPILKRCFVLGVHHTARHPPCGVTTGMLRSCLVGQVSHWPGVQVWGKIFIKPQNSNFCKMMLEATPPLQSDYWDLLNSNPGKVFSWSKSVFVSSWRVHATVIFSGDLG